MSPNMSAAPLWPMIKRTSGVSALAASAAAEEYAGEEGDREPDDAKGERRLPGNAEKTAEEGRDPFAASKFQPGRKQMAKKSAERGGKHGGARRKMGNDQNRDGSLQKIEEKGQRGQILAAGAQERWSRQYCRSQSREGLPCPPPASK